jgi:hypothetical protein
MSKYTEYREIANIMGTMKTVFDAKIDNSDSKITVYLDLADYLKISIPELSKFDMIQITGASGEALYRALKEIYE